MSVLSCKPTLIEEQVSVDIPVISAYLSPRDSVVQIAVRKVILMNKVEDLLDKDIKNADVRLKFQGKEIKLIFNPKTVYYEANAKFYPKDTVKLFVKLENGNEATAETIIPEYVEGIQYKYIDNRLFELFWKNNKTSYYNPYIEKSSSDNSREVLTFTRLDTGKGYFNATKKQASISGKFPDFSLFNNETYKTTIITFEIAQLDSNMYYFQNSSSKNWFNRSPFQDRTPVFNNIKGGLGIFGSYTITKFKTNLNAK